MSSKKTSTNPFHLRSSNHKNLVLNPEDALAMHKCGLITEPSSNGMIWMFRPRLEEPLSIDDSKFSDASNSSPNDVQQIPFLLNSPAHLVWLGYSPTKAHQIVQYFNSIPARGAPLQEADVVEVAKRWIRQSDTDGWWEDFRPLGLTDQFRCTMMWPRYGIRSTQNLKYWLMETLDMRQRALLLIQRQSQNRAKERQMKKTKCSRRSSTRPATAWTDFIDIKALSSDPTPLPGHKSVWKCVDIANVQTLLKKNGELNDLACLKSNDPYRGDFCSFSSCLYFLESKEVAEKYCDWIQNRIEDNCGNVCLVALQIPTSFISSLKPVELFYPSDTWKQVVYQSRCGRPLPKSVSYLHGARAFIGHIAENTRRNIESLDGFEMMDRCNVLTESYRDGFAVQYAFSIHVCRQLSDVCRKTVSLHRSRHSRID